ncbi:U3 small nucleolar ribonucleoprotein protein MPP10-like [Venturia canescens]|uniref:U3 small nucleolar ribonucleoprotein protein MPP10-like n=1 Tax=Venturia canescens TaxID=32260 RepID=UPI001C9CE0F7|nr:U3 small nucleolar ribonucleoprotein protein MPP10-like [Venturia canescens]
MKLDSTNEMLAKKEEKQVKFNLTIDSDETDSLKIGKDDISEMGNESSLEKRQERLRMRIKELERQAISERPWQWKGEVAGPNRPQNSLLEEYVEFDIMSRPVPVITEQTTLKLEDIILQRIQDKAWDDVERKFKPVETPFEYKKKLVMDQEKSKKSLAQIYEDSYIKQRDAAIDPDNTEEREAEEPKEHVEIREMMHSLFAKLDSLSNFHYTPKQAQPEIKIVSNLPAVNMEEVAPVATTDATLLAPEEIKPKPRGELMGRGERTSTDMKRERRKKKLKQRTHQKASEKKEANLAEKLKASGKKYRKGEAAAVINKLMKARNIVKIDETNSKAPKSSTAFFAQLQDQVASRIKTKTGNTFKKKRGKNAHSAVKLKL